ncbi:MAG TPA: 2-succinyl-5-enolpyruvyl-6-hydroxy-3-cyclohexene-1-carboxylic-acid synthase, partial [Verrucomicrobiales bacterium]|nr:2-succinyl-5-enolpyruvyl-6-hydroxy-3-cyclohexene-1-carboxylic-acid synthase [Verrucomicrobiales bacterium]
MSEATAHTLEACLRRGVREFVVCAGARNLSLVLAVIRCEGTKVWSHFEERSAAFFALGRIRKSGAPVAVITTSGTAVAELMPAVIEAHYQQRPLIVITGDRPPRYRASGAPQTIEQVGLFGNYVEGCNDINGEGVVPLENWSGLSP